MFELVRVGETVLCSAVTHGAHEHCPALHLEEVSSQLYINSKQYFTGNKSWCKHLPPQHTTKPKV